MSNIKLIRYYNQLDDYFDPKRALILYGPRQAGKTTLLENYLKNCPYRYKLETGDDLMLQHFFSEADLSAIQDYVAGYELIAIDEAQRIPNIGDVLKIIVDKCPRVRVLATGSSSFELSGQVGEPLTGRKRTLTLYPVSQLELSKPYNPHELKQQLEDVLIFGSYPEVITAETRSKKQDAIVEITHSYLFKDILRLESFKNSKTLVDLLRLLAFQVGSTVSLQELGQQLGIDNKKIARYLDLLEKSFVIYELRGFSRNLRNEVTKMAKYYFYDTGVRNALIANFNPLNLRNDVGMLWENFLIMERIKKQSYEGTVANYYFWRTWTQKEIDWIEEREGKLFAYEFKWGQKPPKPPKTWLEAYPESQYILINQDNYLEFLT